MAEQSIYSKYHKGRYNPKHPLYWRWHSMKTRCYDPSYVRYHRYGGRGIEICDRWFNFELFVKDMLPTFKKGLALDRINNDGNYEPRNCRWVTTKENNRNTSQNVLYEYNGVKLTMGQWAERTGIKRRTLSARVHDLGWSIERALNTQIGRIA